MSQTLLVLAAFIIALGIGIFIGKILFSAKSQSEKSGLEERINGLLGQIEQLKIQFQTERNQFEKSFAQLSSEKENVQKEKESLAIHLAKKENDFETLFKEFPGITKLIFNGKESHKYFLKRFGQIEGITYNVMPSTSPANTMSFENKLKSWSTCFE